MLPFAAFKFIAGVEADPEAQVDGDRALWQFIEDGEKLTARQVDFAETIIADYPPEQLDELRERKAWQQQLGALFDVDGAFGKYDYRFATDLIRQVNEGKLLTETQQPYLEMFVYRYRTQIEEGTIYVDEMPPRAKDVLGENPRQTLPPILAACKEFHDEIKG
ncbi:hypothetical protein ACFQE8_04045 [Salinirubellus sp. GCM10025818]|uniref:hypothetical protein n=1 Tax=Salinirubellus TaxID=2162630 RepID=UPI0030D2E6F1